MHVRHRATRRSADDLPLRAIGKVIKSVSVKKYIQGYEAARGE